MSCFSRHKDGHGPAQWEAALFNLRVRRHGIQYGSRESCSTCPYLCTDSMNTKTVSIGHNTNIVAVNMYGTKPKIAIAENVKNLTSKSMKPVFNTVLSSLEEAGYNNYWQVMNCADYEIPQSRERVLIVSIRKDVDDGKFTFPTPVPLMTCMNDFLDEKVPEQFYLSEEKTRKVIEHNNAHAGQICDRGGICNTLCSRDYKDPTPGNSYLCPCWSDYQH